MEFSAESTALRYIDATTRHLKCSRPYGKRQPLVSAVVRVEIASFRFEDDDENEDQVELLLIVRMLKSVTMMA